MAYNTTSTISTSLSLCSMPSFLIGEKLIVFFFLARSFLLRSCLQSLILWKSAEMSETAQLWTHSVCLNLSKIYLYIVCFYIQRATVDCSIYVYIIRLITLFTYMDQTTQEWQTLIKKSCFWPVNNVWTIPLCCVSNTGIFISLKQTSLEVNFLKK